MFLLNLTYTAPLEEVDRHIAAHKAYLERLYKDRKVLVSGRKVPRTGGLMVILSDSANEVESLIREDPFHVAGVATYEAIQFTPTQAAAELIHLI